MKCSNCGGELIFKGTIGICSSCRSTYKLNEVFENIEVCICYLENDENGRRTRDSIISAEIFKNFEAKKINTFYERISASNVIGDELENIRFTALSQAKIVVLVGTRAENFKILYDKFNNVLTNKIIVPVVSDIKPEDLPQNLRRYQALSIDSIGAINDLLISVLSLLGRGNELELEKVYKKAKKKRILVLTSLLMGIVVIAIVLAIQFWPQKDIPVTITDSDIYNEAITLLNEKKYLEAVAEFNKILDYKDSANQISKIYNRYDGYYQDDKQSCSLYINIIGGKTAEISFERNISNNFVKIEESIVMENNTFNGKYIDNLSNEGDISIKLNDDKIELNISTNIKNAKTSIGELNIQFQIKNKTDRPQIKSISKDILLSWMQNPTSVEDIKAAGYELEYIDTTGPYDESFGMQYKIANSDIILISSNEDLTQYKGQENWDSPKLEVDVVVAAIAPVTFLCPEKIGQSACVFSKNGVVYVPNSTNCLYNSNGTFSFSLEGGSSIMSELNVLNNSYVGVTSQKIGEYNYKYLLKENEEIYYKSVALKQHQKLNPDSPETHIEAHILAENDRNMLINIHTRALNNGLDFGENGSFNYYSFDLSTKECTFITKHKQVSYINSYGSRMYSYDDWKNYPELFSEFL